jgi:hypothetical protein
MNKKSAFPALSCFLILGSALYSLNLKGADISSSAATKTLILYDAASGTIPGAPLMNFTDFPVGAAQPTFSNGATVMDTTVSGNDTYAGWISSGATIPGFPALDRTAGFQVNFTLQVENESHTNNNRAGFSIIILSEDAKGIELAFWQNEIWVQSDDNTGGLFRHGEGIAFATTTGLMDYQVTIADDTYTLTANTRPILTGPVRDYSKFDGFPDPYQTPNFLFLGDDTTSSQARVKLQFLSVTGTEPVVPTTAQTSTSTPLPTTSTAPPASATPIPIQTPTPAKRGIEFCPSGLLIGTMLIVSSITIKTTRQRSNHF